MTEEAVNRIQDVIVGSDPASTSLIERIGQATAELEKATEIYKSDKTELAKAGRDDAALALSALQEEHDKVKAKADADRDKAVDELIAWAKGAREPSLARLFGNGAAESPQSYKAGEFAYNVWARKSDDFSINARLAAEERLRELGVSFHELPEMSKGTLTGGSDDPLANGRGGFEIPRASIESAAWGLLQKYAGYADVGGLNQNLAALKAKATLGTSASTGGLMIPGATVGDIVKPGRPRSAVRRLVDAQTVNQYQTLIPVRASLPTRAAVVAWGSTKTNVNLTYGSYTATMYTLAIIYDVTKQLLRFSAGSVEQDVLGELAAAFELGEAYYILQGSGSSEPLGIQTAIATQFGAFTSSFTASSTTLAGSMAKAIATAAGALGARNRAPEAALLGAAAYWDMLSQGTDSAGFFFAPAGGPLTVRIEGVLGGAAPWGIAVYPETQLAGTDDLIVGEFSALDVFFGESYRVDSSDVANDRWDKNLVGFRGEEEMGLDASPAVNAGAFQFIADITP